MAEAPAASRGDGWPVPWRSVEGESDGLGSRLGALIAHAALAGAMHLPQPALDALIATLAAIGHRTGRRRTRAAHVFLTQALGELSARERERLTRAAWRQLLRVSVETERLFRRVPSARLLEHFEVETSPEARAAFAARRGLLLATPHLGNWEAALGALPRLGLAPVYAVAKPPKNRFLSRSLQASREGRGVRILSRKGAMADAPAILKAGGTLALVIDQRTSGRALLAPFFGRLARCERAPAVLLKRQRVPIVLSACLETGVPLRYHLVFGEVLQPEVWARAEVEEIVQRVNEGFERLIRAHPEQYIWIHDRYRDTPRELAPGAEPRLARRGLPPAPAGGADPG